MISLHINLQVKVIKNGKKKIMLIIKKLLENMIKKKAKYFEVNPILDTL